MGQKLEVRWVPGKQQATADALGRNQIWPGTAENSGEGGSNSGYKEAYFVASEYRASRVFEDELCYPMIEELFIAAKCFPQSSRFENGEATFLLGAFFHFGDS